MICVKCKVSFEPRSADIAKKIQRGHVPLCGDCWSGVYGGLPKAPTGKVAFVENMITAGAAPTRGTKKYICAECKHEQFEPWIIQDRAARIKCPGCGSLRYEPKTVEAKADIADKMDFAKDFGDIKGSDGGQSFVRG